MACGSWRGLVSLDHGRISAARIRDATGCAALELLLGNGRVGEVSFSDGTPSLTADPALVGVQALALLDQVAGPSAPAWLERVPDASLIPRLKTVGLDEGEAEINLSRSEWHMLLHLDGRRDVDALARQFGVLRTVRGLAHLQDVGLVELCPPKARPALGGQLTRGLHQLTARAGPGWEIAQAIVVAGLVVVLVRALVMNFRVEGISMQPTLASGQVLLINRVAYFHLDTRAAGGAADVHYLFGGPKRGDVVVFHSPVQPGTDYVKRIIGLPGDSVAIDGGAVHVNGSPLPEPYIEVPADYRFPASGTAMVPEDSYFVLGDNRPDSLDSHFGWYVPVDDLVGRAWIRYWPPDDLGVVQIPT